MNNINAYHRNGILDDVLNAVPALVGAVAAGAAVLIGTRPKNDFDPSNYPSPASIPVEDFPSTTPIPSSIETVELPAYSSSLPSLSTPVDPPSSSSPSPTAPIPTAHLTQEYALPITAIPAAHLSGHLAALLYTLLLIAIPRYGPSLLAHFPGLRSATARKWLTRLGAITEQLVPFVANKQYYVPALLLCTLLEGFYKLVTGWDSPRSEDTKLLPFVAAAALAREKKAFRQYRRGVRAGTLRLAHDATSQKKQYSDQLADQKAHYEAQIATLTAQVAAQAATLRRTEAELADLRVQDTRHIAEADAARSRIGNAEVQAALQEKSAKEWKMKYVAVGAELVETLRECAGVRRHGAVLEKCWKEEMREKEEVLVAKRGVDAALRRAGEEVEVLEEEVEALKRSLRGAGPAADAAMEEALKDLKRRLEEKELAWRGALGKIKELEEVNEVAEEKISDLEATIRGLRRRLADAEGK